MIPPGKSFSLSTATHASVFICSCEIEDEPATFDRLSSVKELKNYYDNELSKTHLKDLLTDSDRNQALRLLLKPREGDQDTSDGVCFFDYTHCKIDKRAKELLLKVAEETQLQSKL